MFHKNAALGDMHRIANWEVANPTALAALSLAPADVGKVAYQLSPQDVLFLVDDSPATWISLKSAGGSPDLTQVIPIACSDETTALTVGTAKVTLRMPYGFTLSAVRSSVTTAPTGSVLTVDINENGSSILSTKLTIDATEKTSTTAATAAVISDASLADDSEITIDIDAVGSTIAGAGLKVYLIGTKT